MDFIEERSSKKFKRKEVDDILGQERGGLVFHELLNDRAILLEEDGRYIFAPDVLQDLWVYLHGGPNLNPTTGEFHDRG